jgi:hypothetical protein
MNQKLTRKQYVVQNLKQILLEFSFVKHQLVLLNQTLMQESLVQPIKEAMDSLIQKFEGKFKEPSNKCII